MRSPSRRHVSFADGVTMLGDAELPVCSPKAELLPLILQVVVEEISDSPEPGVAATDLAGGGGGQQRRVGGGADRPGAIYPGFQFAASTGLLTVHVAGQRRGNGRVRIVLKNWCGLFAIVVAD